MSTLQQAIDGIKFTTRQYDEITTLARGLNETEVNIALDRTTPGISPGTPIEIDDEVMLIVDTVNPIGPIVIRGYMGTLPASHVDNSPVRISPRNFRFEIFNAIVAEIQSWPLSLYQVSELQVVATNNSASYSLDMGFSVIQGICLDKKTPTGWCRAYGKFARPATYDETRIDFSLWDTDRPTLDYRVRAACKFDSNRFQLNNLGMSIQAAGIPTDYEDIIQYGVLWRLRAPKEDSKVSDPPRGQTSLTQAGQQLQTAGSYLALRDRRIGDESHKLQALHGIRM
jgi:hypothetical protein